MLKKILYWIFVFFYADFCNRFINIMLFIYLCYSHLAAIPITNLSLSVSNHCPVAASCTHLLVATALLHFGCNYTHHKSLKDFVVHSLHLFTYLFHATHYVSDRNVVGVHEKCKNMKICSSLLERFRYYHSNRHLTIKYKGPDSESPYALSGFARICAGVASWIVPLLRC